MSVQRKWKTSCQMQAWRDILNINKLSFYLPQGNEIKIAPYRCKTKDELRKINQQTSWKLSKIWSSFDVCLGMISKEQKLWNRLCTKICLLCLTITPRQMIWGHLLRIWALAPFFPLHIPISGCQILPKSTRSVIQGFNQWWTFPMCEYRSWYSLKSGSRWSSRILFPHSPRANTDFVHLKAGIYRSVFLINYMGWFLRCYNSSIFFDLKGYLNSLIPLNVQECNGQDGECESFCYLRDGIGSALCSFGYL